MSDLSALYFKTPAFFSDFDPSKTLSNLLDTVSCSYVFKMGFQIISYVIFNDLLKLIGKGEVEDGDGVDLKFELKTFLLLECRS